MLLLQEQYVTFAEIPKYYGDPQRFAEMTSLQSVKDLKHMPRNIDQQTENDIAFIAFLLCL